MQNQSALWRCFPEGAGRSLALARVQKKACRHYTSGNRPWAPSWATNSNYLPFGWRPVGLGPSPIGRGRRISWRPPQPADETCISKRGPYSREVGRLNRNKRVRPLGSPVRPFCPARLAASDMRIRWERRAGCNNIHLAKPAGSGDCCHGGSRPHRLAKHQWLIKFRKINVLSFTFGQFSPFPSSSFPGPRNR